MLGNVLLVIYPDDQENLVFNVWMASRMSVQLLRQKKAKANSSVAAFLFVRNEEVRIRHVLEHHRQIGVEEFFVVDNMSTDQTRTILENEEDVNLFLSQSDYSEIEFGMSVLNRLLDEFGSGKWCLTVDADEHFVYPHCEHRTLKAFIRYLERYEFDSVFSLMIDMYSKTSVKAAEVPPNRKLSDVCSYFDRGPYKRLQSSVFPFVKFIGGPRRRMFWERMDGFHPPTISKVPFVKWSEGLRYVSSAHSMSPSPRKLANVTGALLHYKYLSDFHARAIEEVERQQHFANAREYKKYLAKLELNPDLSFHYGGSVRYEKTSDLVKAGLCATTTEWELFN